MVSGVSGQVFLCYEVILFRLLIEGYLWKGLLL